MPKFTLLTKEQIDALDVMKKYGKEADRTDLATILGSYTYSWEKVVSPFEHKFTYYWTASSDEDGYVRCVLDYGSETFDEPTERSIAVRPALSPSETSKIRPSVVRIVDGIRMAEYGQYPQMVADKRTGKRLEKLYRSKSLRSTGKKYTFDSAGLTDYDMPFKATSYPEYELDGKRYIRVLSRRINDDDSLPADNQPKKGVAYWFTVKPIEWLMDKSGWWVSKECLFAGIQFDTNDSYDGDFSKTSMGHYLDTYFAKEMEPMKRTVSRKKANSLHENLTERQRKAKEPTKLVKIYDYATWRALAKALEIKEINTR